LGSTIEVDGLRAIVVTVSASTNNSVELFYVMVDNAEADVVFSKVPKFSAPIVTFMAL
jgi:hypothetical protein